MLEIVAHRCISIAVANFCLNLLTLPLPLPRRRNRPADTAWTIVASRARPDDDSRTRAALCRHGAQEERCCVMKAEPRPAPSR